MRLKLVFSLGQSQTPEWMLSGPKDFPLTPAGYGYTTPLTDGGKAFSIAFALLGVPVTMLLLTASAQRLSLLLTHTPLSWVSQRWGCTPRKAARWHLAILLGVTVTVCFLVPAAQQGGGPIWELPTQLLLAAPPPFLSWIRWSHHSCSPAPLGLTAIKTRCTPGLTEATSNTAVLYSMVYRAAPCNLLACTTFPFGAQLLSAIYHEAGILP